MMVYREGQGKKKGTRKTSLLVHAPPLSLHTDIQTNDVNTGDEGKKEKKVVTACEVKKA